MNPKFIILKKAWNKVEKFKIDPLILNRSSVPIFIHGDKKVTIVISKKVYNRNNRHIHLHHTIMREYVM